VHRLRAPRVDVRVRPERLSGPGSADRVRVWVLTDEGPHETCDTLSVSGVFSSPETAFAYLRGEILGSETFDTLTWDRRHEGFWEAHDPSHRHCQCLTLQTVDHADG
jgi:hypothetical protein